MCNACSMHALSGVFVSVRATASSLLARLLQSFHRRRAAAARSSLMWSPRGSPAAATSHPCIATAPAACRCSAARSGALARRGEDRGKRKCAAAGPAPSAHAARLRGQLASRGNARAEGAAVVGERQQERRGAEHLRRRRGTASARGSARARGAPARASSVHSCPRSSVSSTQAGHSLGASLRGRRVRRGAPRVSSRRRGRAAVRRGARRALRHAAASCRPAVGGGARACGRGRRCRRRTPRRSAAAARAPRHPPGRAAAAAPPSPRR